MIETLVQLPHLSAPEQLALTELLHRLEREYGHIVLRVILYGSGVRGDRSPDSDVDLLIVIRSDDWRTQEPIRFLVARLSNQHDVFVSAWIISLERFERLRQNQPLLYNRICQEGLELLRRGQQPVVSL
jgi:predicted nucleotidyltransferase